jgi:hypothetical protein
MGSGRTNRAADHHGRRNDHGRSDRRNDHGRGDDHDAIAVAVAAGSAMPAWPASIGGLRAK